MTKSGFLLPPIPPEEMTPTVKLLLAIIEQQQITITRLEQRVDRLEAEVARLKKLPSRPKIKPSALGKDPDDDDPPASGAGTGRAMGRGKRPGSKKRRKRTKIHRTQIIPPENLPPGSRLLGYQDYLVQDLLIAPCNTRYRLARYRTPDERGAGAQQLGRRCVAQSVGMDVPQTGASSSGGDNVCHPAGAEGVMRRIEAHKHTSDFGIGAATAAQVGCYRFANVGG
jgi:hypothetical protein